MSAPPPLEWFEQVCLQLQSQPMLATSALEEFREQPWALEAVDAYLRSPACSPMAQFQACFIMQYSSLKNWSLLSGAQVAQLKETLFAVLHSASAGGDQGAATRPPQYALTKVTQCYVLFWKRGWKEASAAERQVLFEQVTRYFQNQTDSASGMHSGGSGMAFRFWQGASLLRMLVEEFAMRSFAEAGLPLEFHRQAHTAFEECGLDQSLQLAMQCLSAAFQMTDAREAVPCIAESVRLLGEVLSWDFGTNAISNAFLLRKPTHSSADYARGTGPSHLLTLPRRWSPLLLNSTFFDSICTVYRKTRSLLGQHILEQQQQGQGQGLGQLVSSSSSPSSSSPSPSSIPVTLHALTELRGLLVSMSSIAGQVFENDGERLSFGSCIMQQVVPLLDCAVDTKWDPSLVDDFRAQECENLGTVLLRLLGNFRLSLCCQMPSFDAMMMSLGRTTFALSKELAELADSQLSGIHGGAAGTSQFLLPGELNLLEGWRGDAVVLFLDAWCMVLDDPLMLNSAFVDGNGNGSGGSSTASAAAQVSTALKLGLRGMAAEVFVQLYESILRITITEALVEPDEEEEENIEAIEVRNLDEMLGAICTVGRTNFSASLDHVCRAIAGALAEAEALISSPTAQPLDPKSKDVLRLLETLRISVLFAAHLCDDTFKANVADEGHSETRLMPSFVLDSCLHAPETTTILQQALAHMTRILQLQLHVASASSAPSPNIHRHPLFSPLLVQILMRFFAEYFVRFVEPDASLYSPATATSIPHLFRMHTADAAACGQLDGMVELLAAAIHQLLVQFPLEGDLVQSMAALLTELSRGSVPGNVLRTLLSSPSVGKIFHCVAGDSRLSSDGTTAIFRALSSLAARANSESTMMSLCSCVHAKVQALPTLSAGCDLELGTEQSVACLRGLAGCPKGQDALLHSLFDACLPVIASSLQAQASADHVAKSILLMMRDYAENKLSGLQAHSSAILYRASMTTLQTFARRLRPSSTHSLLSGEEEQAYRSDCLLHMLELLNHLATKDFVFDDDGDVAAAEDDFHMTVAEVLLFGFDFIVQLVTPDLLRAYHPTAERYFSFSAFITSTYANELGARLCALPASSFFSTLMQHLLWGAGGIAPFPARQALQCIYSLAAFQAASMARSDPGVGMEVATDVFPRALDRLLEMILFPSTCEYGIAWDRVDSCANAFIGLIVLDNQRFMQSAQSAMQQFAAHSPAAQEALLASFRKLTTHNGVSMSNNNKANRQIFVTNFREFVLEVRPLVM